MPGSSQRRRKKEGGEQEEGMERWLLTYADMITLLMAFFVMMWSMSRADTGKFAQMMGSARAAMGMDVTGLYLPPVPTQQITTGTPAILAHDIRRALREKFGDSVVAGSVSVISGGNTVTVRLQSDGILFAAARAELTSRAREVLREVARLLHQLSYEVRVEGHSCDLPLRGGPYGSNWELSAQRALSVAGYFVREGKLPAERLAAIGYGDTRPAVPNINEANRRKNRRVDIKLLKVTSPARVIKIAPAPLPAKQPVVQLPPAPAPAEELIKTETEHVPISIVPPIDIVPRIGVVAPTDIRSYGESPTEEE